MTTLDRIKAHLTDPANYHKGIPVRKHFTTANGITVSIQQSRGHYCSLHSYHLKVEPLPDTSETATVEMAYCPPSTLLDEYGDDLDPYARVPLTVVAAYIDSLEAA